MIAITISNGQITVGATVYNSLKYKAVYDGTLVYIESTVSRDIICQGTFDLITINGVGYASNVALVVAFNGIVSDVSYGVVSFALMKLTPSALAPADPKEGQIYANTNHHLYYYNGSGWIQIG